MAGTSSNGTVEEFDLYNRLPQVLCDLWDTDVTESLISRLAQRTAEENLQVYREKMAFVQPHFFYTFLSRFILICLIGEAKIREGLPLYNEAQHNKVLENWDKECDILGMPAAMKRAMHHVMEEVLYLSLAHEEEMERNPETRHETIRFIEKLQSDWIKNKEELQEYQRVVGREPNIELGRAKTRRKPRDTSR